MGRSIVLAGMIALLCFVQCKKNAPVATLPEATDVGNNTIGFKVNGKVWIPFSACGIGSNPCGAVSVAYGNRYGNPTNNLSIGCERRTGNENATFSIYCLPNTTISSTGNKFDSVSIVYTDYAAAGGATGYSKWYTPKGKVTVTKIDFAKEIVAGTFDCTLYNGSDSIVITDGRFDVKFNACVCTR